MRVGEQLALPLERSREYAFARTQLPFPIAPRLVSRAVRRTLKRLPKVTQVPLNATEAWGARAQLEQYALIEQVRQKARCRARNITGRNSARGFASYAASPEGMRVQRAIRKLTEQISQD